MGRYVLSKEVEAMKKKTNFRTGKYNTIFEKSLKQFTCKMDMTQERID